MTVEKNEEVYQNYVCPKCLYRLPDCKCPGSPPYQILWIDKSLQNHIRILNQKKYKTKFCCEGHDEDDRAHIMFHCGNSPDNLDTLPEGWKYNKRWGRIETKKKYKDMEGGYAAKQKYMDSLLEWIESLPEREIKLWD